MRVYPNIEPRKSRFKVLVRGGLFMVVLTLAATIAAFVGFILALKVFSSDWGYKNINLNTESLMANEDKKVKSTQEIYQLPVEPVKVPKNTEDVKEDEPKEAKEEVKEVKEEKPNVPLSRDRPSTTSVKLVD